VYLVKKYTILGRDWQLTRDSTQETIMSEVYLTPDNWELAINFSQETDNDTQLLTIDDYIDLGEEECN